MLALSVLGTSLTLSLAFSLALSLAISVCGTFVALSLAL